MKFQYSRKGFGKKFRRYQVFFFLSFFLFLASALAEIVLYGSGGVKVLGFQVRTVPFFQPLLTAEAVLHLVSYLLGITVYAPAFSIFASLIRGGISGYIFSCLFASLGGSQSVFLLILCTLYLLSSAWLFCAYSNFCTMVSLRLYTDGILKNVKKEEERLFGGTLFNSTLFCNTVNLRFLCTYTLLFLASLFSCAALVLLYAFFRSLIY